MLSIEEIKLLIEKLEKVKNEDLQKLIDTNLRILKDLALAVDANNTDLIDRYDKTPKWFKRDLKDKQLRPVVDALLEKNINSKIYQFAKSDLYNSLEIGPGLGMFSKQFLAWRLNYFLDISWEIEKNIRQKFNQFHQKKIRFYKTTQTDCKSIPSSSCNFVFSWDTFVFFTQAHISQYLKDIKRVMVDGGYCMIQYADCHYDFDLGQAKRGYWNYNTKTSMEKIIIEQGYEVIEMNQFRPGANYAIFRKPGKQNPVVYKVSDITLD